jgi:hypothetical protein
MEDDSKVITRIGTNIGNFTLTEPIISEEYPTPKNFLIRTEKTPEKKAEVKCVTTKTGHKFCLFHFDNIELEGMQMGIPSCVYSKMVKEGISFEEASNKCIKEGKEAFLVIKCEPKEFCKL